jgi:hypothetical protein
MPVALSMMMVWQVALVSVVALLLAILAPLRLVQVAVLVVQDGLLLVLDSQVLRHLTAAPITLQHSPLAVSVVVSVLLLWQVVLQALLRSQLSLKSGTRWHPFGAVVFTTAHLHSTVAVAVEAVAVT